MGGNRGGERPRSVSEDHQWRARHPDEVVNGYAGGNEMLLAMERGEVGGRCGWSWSSGQGDPPGLDRRKQINILRSSRCASIRNCRTCRSCSIYAKTDEDRSILKLIFARQVFA